MIHQHPCVAGVLGDLVDGLGEAEGAVARCHNRQLTDLGVWAGKVEGQLQLEFRDELRGVREFVQVVLGEQAQGLEEGVRV